jgi:hypothetical protein
MFCAFINDGLPNKNEFFLKTIQLHPCIKIEINSMFRPYKINYLVLRPARIYSNGAASYCHFHKIKIRNTEWNYSGERYRAFPVLRVKIKTVEKWQLTWLKYVYWLFLQPAEQS